MQHVQRSTGKGAATLSNCNIVAMDCGEDRTLYERSHEVLEDMHARMANIPDRNRHGRTSSWAHRYTHFIAARISYAEDQEAARKTWAAYLDHCETCETFTPYQNFEQHHAER